MEWVLGRIRLESYMFPLMVSEGIFGFEAEREWVMELVGLRFVGSSIEVLRVVSLRWVFDKISFPPRMTMYANLCFFISRLVRRRS